MKPISADDTFQSASGRIPSCSSGRKLGRKFVQPLLRTHIPSSSYDFVVNKVAFSEPINEANESYSSFKLPTFIPRVDELDLLLFVTYGFSSSFW